MIELPKLGKLPKRSLGIYAGSFDPFHIGHMDIVKQAKEIFDEVLVAKGVNPAKAGITRYPLPENTLLKMGVIWCNYQSLLSDLIKWWEKSYNVVLVRGLRNGADLEYEQNLIAFLKGMHPDAKVVAFYSDPKYRHLSSSALRDIKNFSKEEYQKYVIED